MSTTDTNISRNLANALNQMPGVTLYTVAGRTKMLFRTLYQWSTGQREPQAGSYQLRRLSAALGVQEGYRWNGKQLPVVGFEEMTSLLAAQNKGKGKKWTAVDPRARGVASQGMVKVRSAAKRLHESVAALQPHLVRSGAVSPDVPTGELCARLIELLVERDLHIHVALDELKSVSVTKPSEPIGRTDASA